MNKSLSDKLKILFLLFVFLPFFSPAQDSIKKNIFVFNGYLKDMQTFIFQDFNGDWVSSNLVHNRLNFKWLISSKFTASLEMRNRFLYGDILTAYPEYNETFESDQGIADLSKNLIDESSALLNLAIDRLWLQYSSEKFQVTVGRQRINWGQTFVWNPNDIFNTYSYFDFDYEERPGSDAIRIQYNSGPASIIEFAAKVNNEKKGTFAGLYRFNKWNYDFQFIAGIADQEDYVIGTGWSGQLLKGGFRGEATYFYPEKNFNDTTGIFLASVGYDYTFKNSLFLQFETLYNGNDQAVDIFLLDKLTSEEMSPKNLFLPDFSMFGSLSYPITPLVNSSLAVILNPEYELFFLVPFINVSVKENLELSFTAQLMRYFGTGETNLDMNFVYARLKYSF